MLFDLPLNLAFEGVFTALILPDKMDPPILLLLLLLLLPTIGLSRDDDDDDSGNDDIDDDDNVSAGFVWNVWWVELLDASACFKLASSGAEPNTSEAATSVVFILLLL